MKRALIVFFVLVFGVIALALDFISHSAVADDYMCHPITPGGFQSRNVSNPATGNSYALNGRGCANIRTIDISYFSAQGFVDYASAGPGGAGVIGSNANVPPNLPTNGTSDAQPAIQAAIDRNRDCVYLPAGTNGGPVVYTLNRSLTILSNTCLYGPGAGQVTLKLADGVNADVLVGQGAYSLFGGATEGGIQGFEIYGLTLDGNNSNQVCSDPNACNGLAVYGYFFRLHDLVIQNIVGHGMRTEWNCCDEAPTIKMMESTITNVTTRNVGRDGWLLNGPHDIDIRKFIAIDSSQEADNTYYGIYSTTVGRATDFHGWHTAAATNRVKYQASSGGGMNWSQSFFEGGRGQLEFRGNGDTVVGSAIFAPVGANPMLLIAGVANSVVGTAFNCIPGQANYAIQFGATVGNAATGNFIKDAIITDCEIRTPFLFQNDNGYNVISGIGVSAIPSQTTIFGGTPSCLTQIDYDQVGGGTNIHYHSRGCSVLSVGTDALLNSGNSNSANVAVGNYAGRGIGGGTSNTVLGFQTHQISNGINDVAVGTLTLFNGCSDISNTAIGSGSMLGSSVNCLTGSNNTAIGVDSLPAISFAATGNNAFGSRAGAALTSGSFNLLIGTQVAASLTTGSRNIIVGGGANCDVSAATVDWFQLCSSTGAEHLLSGSISAGTQLLNVSKQLTIFTASGNVGLDFSPPAVARGLITFRGNGATKWQLGKETDDSLLLWDQDGASNQLVFRTGQPIRFASAPQWTNNGTVGVSLTALGPAGSHTTVQTWLTVLDSAGTTRFIPAY